MRAYPRLFVSALVAAAIPVACGHGSGSSGAPAGGHGGAATSGVTSAGGTSTGGAANGCAMGPFDLACEACVEASCCAEASACYGDADCDGCITGTALDPTKCAPGSTPAYDALEACVGASCKAVCTVMPACNPVTNEGCDAAKGEACDVGMDGFDCFAPPPSNDTALCAACDDQGAACLPGSTCLAMKCTRYCCDDGDCGTGKCDMTQIAMGFGVGVCLSGAAPACDAPAVAPSHGACFTGGGADAGDGGMDAGDSG